MLLQEQYGANVLALMRVQVQTYLRKLLANRRVAKFLAQKYPDYLTEFQRIVDTELAGPPSGPPVTP